MIPIAHKWRSTLIHLRRHFINKCSDVSEIYNGFDVETSERKFTDDGERIWATYALFANSCIPWWKASFLDTKIAIISHSNLYSEVNYGDIDSIILPATKTSLPEIVDWCGIRYNYDIAYIQTKHKEKFELIGARGTSGKRDVFLWHVLLATKMDKSRLSRIAQNRNATI